MGKKPSRRPADSQTGARVRIGGALYIRNRNVRLLDRPTADARVIDVLQPPTEVTWLGPDSRDRRWQKIRHGTQVGVVLGANLSTTKPDMQVHGVTATMPCRCCKGSGRLVLAEGSHRVSPPGWRPTQYGVKAPAAIVCPVCGGSGIDPDDPVLPRVYGGWRDEQGIEYFPGSTGAKA